MRVIKKLRSISLLLQAITGAMAVALVVIFALFAEQAFERRQAANHVLATAAISRDLFNAMQNFRVERGTVNTAIETPEIIDQDTQSDIALSRDQAERALGAAIAKVEVADLEGTAPWLRTIRAAHDGFVLLRREADAALRLPKAQRRPGLSANWIAGVGKLVDAIDSFSEFLSSDINQADPFITEMMEVKQLGWMVRDAAGYDRLLVGAAIANGTRLRLEQLQQFAVLTGRIEAAWKAIEDDVALPTTPIPLKAAVEGARKTYFAERSSTRSPRANPFRFQAPFGSGFPIPAWRASSMWPTPPSM